MSENNTSGLTTYPVGLVEAMLDAVFVLHFDEAGTIDFCSQYSLLDWEITTEQLLGVKFSELIDPQGELAFTLDERLQSLREGGTFSSRFELRLPNGRSLWMKAGFHASVDADGVFHGVTLTGVDVSHAQRREMDIRTRLAAIENTQLTAEFMMGGMILSANDIFCHVLGYETTELVCEDARRLQDEAILSDADYAEFWSDRDSGLPFVGELHLRSKSGKDIYIQGSLDPVLDADGMVDKIVLYATDVTERKTALNQLSRSIAQLRDGDLAATIDEPFNIELEPLREDFNQMVNELAALVNAITYEAQGVSSTSQQIAASAEVLQQRSDQQGQTLAQTLRTITATSGKIETTARTADQGNRVAEVSMQRVTESRDSVSSVREAMEAIRAVSGQINRFITVINSIALQSRILGFNAAVEAARAGDAGRGFAIVANEVRSLATKTAEAASQISDLVHGIEKSVNVASDRVTGSGVSIGSVLTSVEELRGQMSTIAQQCGEQAVAMRDLTTQMGAVDRLNKDNRLMAQDNQAVAADLLAKSDTLMNKMSLFQTAPGSAAAGRSDAEPASRRFG